MRRINERDRKGMCEKETEREPWYASRPALVKIRLRVTSMRFRGQTYN